MENEKWNGYRLVKAGIDSIDSENIFEDCDNPKALYDKIMKILRGDEQELLLKRVFNLYETKSSLWERVKFWSKRPEGRWACESYLEATPDREICRQAYRKALEFKGKYDNLPALPSTELPSLEKTAEWCLEAQNIIDSEPQKPKKRGAGVLNQHVEDTYYNLRIGGKEVKLSGEEIAKWINNNRNENDKGEKYTTANDKLVWSTDAWRERNPQKNRNF